jgi:NTE family protein
MTTGDQTRPTGALILGGGGVTGIAWEIGVPSGLLSAGVDLRSADVVIGTSAGAFVGAAYASGYEIEQLFAEQLEAPDAEVATAASETTVTEWLEAFRVGGADRARVGAEFGKIAKAHPEPIPLERRRRGGGSATRRPRVASGATGHSHRRRDRRASRLRQPVRSSTPRRRIGE